MRRTVHQGGKGVGYYVYGCKASQYSSDEPRLVNTEHKEVAIQNSNLVEPQNNVFGNGGGIGWAPWVNRNNKIKNGASGGDRGLHTVTAA